MRETERDRETEKRREREKERGWRERMKIIIEKENKVLAREIEREREG